MFVLALVVCALVALVWGARNGVIYGDALGAGHAAKRLAPLIEALHAYRADHKQVPRDITPLIPEYLTKDTRYDGLTWDGWHYVPSGGSFMLYRHALAYRYDEGEGPSWVLGLRDDGTPPAELDIPVGMDVEQPGPGEHRRQ